MSKYANTYVQINTDDYAEILESLDTKDQSIKIFELYPPAVENMLREISSVCSKSRTKSRVYIHIHPLMRDYRRYLRHLFQEDVYDEDRVKIILCQDSKSEDMFDGSYRFAFSSNYQCFNLNVFRKSITDTETIGIATYQIAKYMYNVNNAVISTKLQLEYPDMFRDVILKQFKKVTPHGILEGFKDDEDMFNFIKEEMMPKPDDSEDQNK